MFNFNELEIVYLNEPNYPRGSFVGIRQDKYLGKMAFTLPKGFDNFEKNYDNVKKLFFSMYRTFNKFCQNNQNNSKQFDEKPTSKDNVQIDNYQGAYIFTDEDNNETILYSKIDLIEKIFETYRELEIESLIQEIGLIEDVDYSKIENYLDKGIYLKNNAIFIEHTLGYRNIVRGVPSELIELFCYIYKELANELEKELSEQIKEIAFNFSYQYLSPEQSLFSEHSFDMTIGILKDCLDNIHKITAYKNAQYWDIYEAIEHFLYGNLKFDAESNQEFWGIDNFSYIWEEMCNSWMAQNKDYEILYCDTNLQLNKYRDNLSREKRVWIDYNQIQNVFHIELNGFRRWIRPDIIIESRENHGLSGNPLIVALSEKILSIEKSPVPKILSLYTNRINVEFKLNSNKEKNLNSDSFDISKQIFENFVFGFKNLHKRKRNNHNKLKGYQYESKNKYHFILKNIDKTIYEEIYQNILNKGNKSKQGLKNVKYIVDWKYYSYTVFDNPEFRKDRGINLSIIKSNLYEFCLSKSINDEIVSQFGLPFYDIKHEEIILSVTDLNCGIQIVKLNFPKIQEIYLK